MRRLEKVKGEFSLDLSVQYQADDNVWVSEHCGSAGLEAKRPLGQNFAFL